MVRLRQKQARSVLNSPMLNKCNWFVRPQPRDSARLRLFCFPFAGGGSPAFHNWPASLPKDVDLFAAALPGRSQRFAEPPYERLQPLVADFCDAILPLLDRPFALFGHSMGGLIAFELARRLIRSGQQPAKLFVSACVAPHLRFPRAFSHLRGDEFFQAVAALNGMPEAVLADAELRRVIMPSLLADFVLTESYVLEPGPPLSCRILAYAGSEDPLLTRESLQAWNRHTSSTFRLQVVAGDHSLASCQDAILEDLSRETSEMLGLTSAAVAS